MTGRNITVSLIMGILLLHLTGCTGDTGQEVKKEMETSGGVQKQSEQTESPEQSELPEVYSDMEEVKALELPEDMLAEIL